MGRCLPRIWSRSPAKFRHVEIKANVLEINGRKIMQGFFRDITAEARYHHERETTLNLLRLLNDPNNTHELVRSLTGFFQQWMGCEAVGIRLRDGDDFPYFETRGFPAEFVQAGKPALPARRRRRRGAGLLLAIRSWSACAATSFAGGSTRPCRSLPPKGSFWTNCTSELLASTSEADRQARTRNRCNGEGYESVALIALRHGGETIGLLQLNDRAKDRFTLGNDRLLGTAPPIRSPWRWRSVKVRPPCGPARGAIAPCSRTC